MAEQQTEASKDGASELPKRAATNEAAEVKITNDLNRDQLVTKLKAAAATGVDHKETAKQLREWAKESCESAGNFNDYGSPATLALEILDEVITDNYIWIAKMMMELDEVGNEKEEVIRFLVNKMGLNAKALLEALIETGYWEREEALLDVAVTFGLDKQETIELMKITLGMNEKEIRQSLSTLMDMEEDWGIPADECKFG